MHGLSNMDYHSPRLTLWLSQLNAHLQAIETKTEPPMWHYFLRWLVGTLTTPPSWKVSLFILTGIATYPGQGFAFSACNASAKATSSGLIECLTHCHGIHISLLLIKGHISQQKKCDNGPRFMEFTGVAMFPTILKQSAGKNDGMAFWRLRYNILHVTISSL